MNDIATLLSLTWPLLILFGSLYAIVELSAAYHDWRDARAQHNKTHATPTRANNFTNARLALRKKD